MPDDRLRAWRHARASTDPLLPLRGGIPRWGCRPCRPHGGEFPVAGTQVCALLVGTGPLGSVWYLRPVVVVLPGAHGPCHRPDFGFAGLPLEERSRRVEVGVGHVTARAPGDVAVPLRLVSLTTHRALRRRVRFRLDVDVVPYPSGVVARRSMNERYARNWCVLSSTSADHRSDSILVRPPTYTVATPSSYGRSTGSRGSPAPSGTPPGLSAASGTPEPNPTSSAGA